MKKARTILVTMALSGLLPAFGQWNDFGGNSISSTEYLGANGSSTVPLLLKTVANQPIDFSTSNLLRAQINERVTYPTLGGFTNVIADGYTLITGEADAITNVNSRAPFSRLHLVDDVGATDPNVYAQEYGFRNWMRNGITFSGNSDQAYIGQRYAGDDNTDFVIQWSDNVSGSQWGTDRLKFVFTGGYNSGSPSGQNSLQGLEAMRLWPRDGNNVNVGIGDFSVPNTDPTERLHVLSGRVRIQQLPDNPEAPTLTKVLVVDDSPSPNGERGVLKWRNINNLTSCDWQIQPNNDVASVYGGSACPWTSDNFVGVGLQNPKAKLEVYHDGTSPNFSGDVTLSTLRSGTAGGRALSGVARTPTSYHFNVNSLTGVEGSALNAKYSIGVKGIATNDSLSFGSSLQLIGVSGEAIADSNATIAVGVYGKATGANGGQNWAGLFQGNVKVTGIGVIPGGVWQSSDEGIKENIADLANGTAVVQQLSPRSYTYVTGPYPQEGLPIGQQFGFLAQELQEVIPEAVKPYTIQAVTDSMGNVLQAAQPSMVINQTTIIPFLVAALKEQIARTDVLQARVDQCCAATDPGLAPQDGAAPKQGTGSGELQDQRLQIIPNPVAELTTLAYHVPKAGRVVLQVSTLDGKPLATLREEMAEPGAYQYTWNTSKLAAGTYLCTFLLDDAVVMQRAVKVAR